MIANAGPATTSTNVANKGDKLVAIDGNKVGPEFFNGTKSNWARSATGTKMSVTKENGATVMLTMADYF